ncbi:MAG: helix-turn-helix transcriptional regulator [Myxococcales bacterium]|nr:helix-turn-helix transcriptional regulator [Myxococcales bacterium]
MWGLVAPIGSTDFRKDFGRRAAELRRALRLTQAQLAEQMRISPNYVARIEGGLENLTLDSIERLAASLGVRAWKLFLRPRTRAIRYGRPPQKKSGHGASAKRTPRSRS